MVDVPGAMTKLFRIGDDEELHLFVTLPNHDNVEWYDKTQKISNKDGLMLIVASVDFWRLILTSSGKLGWICDVYLGVSFSGSTYSMRS
jgi:hypothetical protein